MDLEMRAESTDDGLVLRVVGELTGPVTSEFKTWAMSEVEKVDCDVFVDCSKLHFIDSSGLGALIYLRKLVIERGGGFRLTEVSGWLQKFLQVTGLEETFCGASDADSSSVDHDAEGHKA